MSTNQVITLISRIREKANRLITAELKKTGLHGLVPSHGSILATLCKEGPLTMKQIAERIHKDKSTVTALVDKLEKGGYVRRCAHERSGRITVVHLTERCRSFKTAFNDISATLLATVYKGIDESEKEELVRILKKIDANF